jgi:putative ABC transport system substrate-binding protein
MMRRREFITLLAGGAAGWPLAARAQQPERVRRIGLLMAWAEGDPEAQPRLAAFMTTLRELGWIDGRNCRIECAGPPATLSAWTAMREN